jgi:ribosomal protein S18 acetylase RimI-like enzyme
MVRDYSNEDLPALRLCLAELQNCERGLDPRLPPGAAIADAYLELLFHRCRQFNGRVFVAEVEGRVVGYVSVLGAYRSDEPDDDPAPLAYVADLVVLPEQRGHGWGRALLRKAEEYAASCGRSSLRLSVKAGNQQARTLYAGGGYSEYEIELEKRLGSASNGERRDLR